MQCLIWFVALWSVAAAAAGTPLLLRRGYQEQDTARAFYSYGYSDENAARAEYTAGDGSSRGFYAYVDANGQLQTVKYEAGGRQGFQAEASNQPQAPVDDRQPPLPVTDTAEVQQARQAHLSAVEQERERERERGEQQVAAEEQPLSDEDAAILERVRAMLESREERNESNDELQPEEQARQRKQEQERERERERDAGNDLRLRTVYSLSDISSSSYLKLSDLEDRLNRNSQELRVPVSSYYAYISPDAKYSVTTPTELRSLRPVALSRSLILSKRN